MNEKINKQMRNIGILAKTHHHLSSSALQKIIDFLKKNEYTYWLEKGCRSICDPQEQEHLVEAEELARKIDVLFVLGGDGTFLYGARLVENTRIPVLGINLGRLGFLTEITVDEIEQMLSLFAQSELLIEERVILKVALVRNNKILAEHKCLNDAV